MAQFDIGNSIFFRHTNNNQLKDDFRSCIRSLDFSSCLREILFRYCSSAVAIFCNRDASLVLREFRFIIFCTCYPAQAQGFIKSRKPKELLIKTTLKYYKEI